MLHSEFSFCPLSSIVVQLNSNQDFTRSQGSYAMWCVGRWLVSRYFVLLFVNKPSPHFHYEMMERIFCLVPKTQNKQITTTLVDKV